MAFEGQNAYGVREHAIRTLDLEIGFRGERVRPVDRYVIGVVERRTDLYHPIYALVHNEGDLSLTLTVESTDDVADEATPFGGSQGTVAFVGAVSDGETIILDDGTNPPVTFEFDDDDSVVETPTLRQVVIESSFTQAYSNLRRTLENFIAAVQAAHSASPLLIDAEDLTPQHGSANRPDPIALLTNRQSGAVGDVAIVETGANFTVFGMANGKDPISVRSYVDPTPAAVTSIVIVPGGKAVFSIEGTTEKYLRFKATPAGVVLSEDIVREHKGHLSLSYWYGSLEEYERSNATKLPQLA